MNKTNTIFVVSLLGILVGGIMTMQAVVEGLEKEGNKPRLIMGLAIGGIGAVLVGRTHDSVGK